MIIEYALSALLTGWFVALVGGLGYGLCVLESKFGPLGIVLFVVLGTAFAVVVKFVHTAMY